ncbi:MAG: dioxygenase [Burkholderiales bacterium]|nr:dioxygenase [Burkholderiales bacterium]
MTAMPTLFVSHGSPMLALDPGATGAAWRAMADKLPRPRAIVMVSAHWTTTVPAVSTTAHPATIHDFYGFPEPLYALHYEPAGAPEVAEEVAQLLSEAGLKVGIDPARGLDHGAWVPLRSMYPDADIPVMQLAIQPRETPAHHLAVGRALASLPQSGILLIASGSLTHNLRELYPEGSPVPDYAARFTDWMTEKLAANDLDALLDYRHQAPDAQRAHPTDEHLIPLYVALGAAGDTAKATRFHHGFTHGGLAMDAYAFYA